MSFTLFFSKYIFEIILSYFLLRIFNYLRESKLFPITIYVLNFLSFINSARLKNFLLKNIINHLLFSTLVRMKTFSFLRYCKNEDYRNWLTKIYKLRIDCYSKHINSMLDLILNKKILSSPEKFYLELENQIAFMNSEFTNHVLKLEIHNEDYTKFTEKLLYLLEFISDIIRPRLIELKNEKHNVLLLNKYFFILKDCLD